MHHDSKSQPLAPRAPKAISKLNKLEREISGIAGRVRGGIDRSRSRLKKWRTALFKAIKQNLVVVIALLRPYRLAITTSARKLINVAIRAGSRPSVRKSNVVPPAAPSMRKNPKTNALEHLFISACLGLITVSGILILVLFLQIRDMKAKIEQSEIELATNKAHLNRVEKLTQQNIATQQTIINEPTPAKKAQPPHLPLSFSDADIKIIRQYIKVLPPKPGSLQKIHLGDEIKDLAVAPVSESLISQLPKLRGARFSIDQDGAIIIIGEGSNRVDAVLSLN
jgi:hypothetical protein